MKSTLAIHPYLDKRVDIAYADTFIENESMKQRSLDIMKEFDVVIAGAGQRGYH
jgi:hypothetical protein